MTKTILAAENFLDIKINDLFNYETLLHDISNIDFSQLFDKKSKEYCIMQFFLYLPLLNFLKQNDFLMTTKKNFILKRKNNKIFLTIIGQYEVYKIEIIANKELYCSVYQYLYKHINDDDYFLYPERKLAWRIQILKYQINKIFRLYPSNITPLIKKDFIRAIKNALNNEKYSSLQLIETRILSAEEQQSFDLRGKVYQDFAKMNTRKKVIKRDANIDQN